MRELLERGYRVRGSVRDPSDASKTAHLRTLPGAAERLELVAADVLRPADWADALNDADGLVHCATAVLFTASDPQREIVDVAVDGTRNVLGAAARSPATHAVVQLSSIAAQIGYDKPREHVFTADDWCDDATPKTNPYALGKVLSERLAREIAHGDPGAKAPGFRLASINPGYVLGPLLAKGHCRTSPSIVRDMLRRTFPGCPPLNFNVVDVRDVATACAIALERDDLDGRYPLVEGRYWWRDLALVLGQLFPERGISTWTLPSALIYLSTLFDRRVSFRFLRRNLHRVSIVPGDAASKALGLPYIGLEQMLRDTARSLVDLGLA